MSPPRASALVHLGDTSFRRRDVIAGYRDMLAALSGFRVDDQPWDAAAQAQFYGLLRTTAPDIFGGGGPVGPVAAARRARTYTSALVKLGFVDEHQRRLTALGAVFDDGDARLLDDFDRLCALTPENSAILRGALSYTESTGDGGRYFPVRLLLRVLNAVGDLRTDEFALVFIAGPRYFGIDPEPLIDAVHAMRTDGATLENLLLAAGRSRPQEQYIASGIFTAEAFPNRKGATYVARYREFLAAVTDFRAHPSMANLARLRRAVDDGGTSVAKRFGPARALPGLAKHGDGPLTVHAGARYPAWAGGAADFRRALVDLFNGNRTTSLIDEYLDNNLRILTATGVISVAGDRVRIGSPYARFFFSANDDRLEVIAPPVLPDARRAAPVTVTFGPDALARTDARITAEHGVPPAEIEAFIAERDRERFDATVSAAFPPSRVHEYLGLIATDHRSAAVNAVRDRAFGGKPTIPCLYEYLIGLSLYYAAGRTFDLRRAFGLSLDGDFLPISHAPGLRGDIEFELDGRRILVEVTLMDPATQRRGELEPVLRHATNFACDDPATPALTLFIANEVDPNVARIFGFARVMAMAPTDTASRPGPAVPTASPLIVSLTTRDWLDVADAPLSQILELASAEADRRDVDHLNSDWNSALVERMRTAPRLTRASW